MVVHTDRVVNPYDYTPCRPWPFDPSEEKDPGSPDSPSQRPMVARLPLDRERCTRLSWTLRPPEAITSNGDNRLYHTLKSPQADEACCRAQTSLRRDPSVASVPIFRTAIRLPAFDPSVTLKAETRQNQIGHSGLERRNQPLASHPSIPERRTTDYGGCYIRTNLFLNSAFRPIRASYGA